MLPFKAFLKSIDLFGQPIQLSFNQNPVQKSLFGGFNTLLLISLFAIIAFQGFLSIVMRANITSYTTDIFSTQPPALNVDQKLMNWAITFQPADANVWQGNGKYFQLEILQGIYTRDVNGTVVKQKIPLELQPCRLESFETNAQQSLLGLTTNISTFLCPKDDEKFFIEGKFSSARFSFLNFKISKCVNKTNETCASQEKIDSFFTKNGNKIYFNLLLMNNIINIYDFENTLYSFLDDRTYVLLNRDSYKEKNFYLTKNTIYTDDSILMTNYKEDLDTYVFENNYDETEVPLSSKDSTYCSIYLRSNFLAKHQFRTFEKLGRFISYIGGFWSVLFLFFSILGKKYNKHKLLVKMANELYDFEAEKLESLRRKDEEKAGGKLGFFGLNILQKKNLESNAKQIKVADLKSQKNSLENIDRNIQSYVQKKTQNKLIESIKYLFECFFRKKESKEAFKVQQTLREKAFCEIYKEVDIINLLRKLKQIDKIKALLLNHEQRNLFDFSKKTLISEHQHLTSSTLRILKKIKSRKFSASRKKVDKFQENFKEIKSYYDAFWVLKNDTNEKNAKFNEKILGSMDPELVKIFQSVTPSKVENFPIYTVKESFTLSNNKQDSQSQKSEQRIVAPKGKMLKQTWV